ncbi:MAG: hypothetical protein EBR42_06470 [Betaproteobacteria bacterium]|nr:hypothetical protein [Betaproteobacteria bacterium]
MGASVRSQYLQTLVVLKSSHLVASKAPAGHAHAKQESTNGVVKDENLKTTAIPLSNAIQRRIIPNPLLGWELGQRRPKNSDPCDH